MMATSRDNLALHLHAAVETLISAPSIDSYNRLSTMLATMTQAGMVSESLNLANACVNSICDRYERVGRIGVSEEEASILREKSGELDRLLARVPANVFQVAKATVHDTFEAMQGE